MRSIAVYSLKGGVGKTTLAVNLAWAAATRSARKTLLWDLDAQSAASYLLGAEGDGPSEAQGVFAKEVNPTKLVQTTATPRLDLLAADASLRGLDHFLHDLDKKKRLLKLIERLGQDYDRIILDAPPGLTDTSEQVLRAADLILVPLIPSPLSQRAFDEVLAFLDRNQIRHGPVLPVYNMVDRRRSLHLAALAAHADWPVVPMASAFEAMSATPDGVGRLRAGSPPETAVTALWKSDRKAAGPLRLMKNLDPDLLLRAYAIGVFPMSDSRDARDVYWVEPRRRAIIPLDGFHVSQIAAQDAAVGSVRGHRSTTPSARSCGAARRARTPGSTTRSSTATICCTARATPIRSRSGWKASSSAASTASGWAPPSSAKACSRRGPTPRRWRSPGWSRG